VTSGDPVQSIRRKQSPKVLVAQLPRRSLRTEMLAACMSRNVSASGVQWQIMPISQLADELCVSLSLGSAQFVIEVNYRQDNAQFLTQLEHDSQQRNRVSPARDSQPQAVASAQQLLATYIIEDASRQSAHGKHSTSRY
jgi:hypothetical protein